jgi:hypothetical protein
MVKAIEASPEPSTIDLGFTLLTLGEDTVAGISAGIDQIANQAVIDGKNHDLTVAAGSSGTGLTIHCNDDPMGIAGPALQRHCYARKYTERSQTWFGVCLRPSDQALRFGVNLDFTWEQDDAMDSLTSGMGKPKALADLFKSPSAKPPKIGRNQPCPCGSGKKFKKCCLPGNSKPSGN